MKRRFEKSILQKMKTDNRIVLLIADELSEELKEIEKIFPDRLFMFGIAECNIIGAAAGLARAGFIPVVYTVAAFLAFRAFEFIRCDVCINKFNVKIVGYASGVKINNFGSAHHAIEDIAVLRSLPNLNLLSPASANEVEPILTAALGCDSPVYIRLGKAFETEIFEKEISFEIGKSKTVRDGKDVTVIGTGNIISNAIEAAKTLSEKGIDCEIINLSSIKPLDKEIIIKSISKTKRVLTIEEHQITGGIGSAVAEIIAENRINCAFERMGFADKFVTEYGWHKEILEQNGLATEDVVRSIVKIIA